MNSYIHSLFSLEGKSAIVIGGTGVLCGAMAESLALAGAETVIVGRDPDKAKERIQTIEAKGGKAYFIPCDISSREELESLRNSVIKRSGGIDILVNGAGVNSPTPYLKITEDEFENILDINLKGIFRSCQIFGKYFIEQNKPGNIINIGFMSGIIPISRVFTYSLTKAAVHNLSKNLAREWATKKIRVNTLVPRFFPAEQNRKILNEDRVNSIMNHTPAKRFGEASELAGATLLLASESAASFITGHELVIDGDFASMSKKKSGSLDK